MYGSGGRVEAVSPAEYGARFWLAWGGSEWEEELMSDSDSFFADADLMSAAEAEGSDLEEESDEEESDAAADTTKI